MPAVLPTLTTHPCIQKRPAPILTSADLPYASSLVFNAGVIKYRGEYVMIFRNDYGTDQRAYETENKRFAGTGVGIARSKNGVDGWRVEPQMLLDSNDPFMDPELRRFYDPRIVQIEDRLLLCLAADTRHGVCGVIAALSDDLQTCRVLSTTAPDNRNLVLFPEKIGGEYVRLERPMPVYSRGKDRFDIWISRSPDLVYWGQNRPRVADAVSRGGPRRDARQKRLGDRVEKALHRRIDAAGLERSVEGAFGVSKAADRAGHAAGNRRGLPAKRHLPLRDAARG